MSDDLQTTISRAEEMLAALPPRPWTFMRVTNPDQDPQIGTLRDKNGWPVIAVHPESSTMMTGKSDTFEFLAEVPDILQALVDGCKTPEKSEIKPNRGGNTPELGETG